jgi:hypothetical protein
MIRRHSLLRILAPPGITLIGLPNHAGEIEARSGLRRDVFEHPASRLARGEQKHEKDPEECSSPLPPPAKHEEHEKRKGNAEAVPERDPLEKPVEHGIRPSVIDEEKYGFIHSASSRF